MNDVEAHVSEEVEEDASALWEMVQWFSIYEEASYGNDDEKKKFDKQWTRHISKFRGIIAFKGLPLTGKTEYAVLLGERVKCPVLCIQDFLPSPPANDDERMLEGAFSTLCKVAKHHMKFDSTVVIKSRLNSHFEIQELLKLATSVNSDLLILEFNFRNVFLWKLRFEEYYKSKEATIEQVDIKWYRPRSWNEMEDAMDDYNQSNKAELDDHLKKEVHDRISTSDHPLVRKLVVDVFDDLFYNATSQIGQLPDDFVSAIRYLLTAPKHVFHGQNPYTVELSMLRPLLFEQSILALSQKEKREHPPCPDGGCVFKRLPDAAGDQEPNHKSLICNKCDKQVLAGEPAYTCRVCTLALHESCAQRIEFNRLLGQNLGWMYYTDFLTSDEQSQVICKPCEYAKKDFSLDCGACVFLTHLKWGPLPTILKHDFHYRHHFLSLITIKKYCPCKACGRQGSHMDYSYGCKQCALYYHLECAMLPTQLNHQHGGYDHVMELKYSHNPDDVEKKEDYWCDSCYAEMDPNYWFYSCKECPYYVAHLKCAGAYEAFLAYRKDLKFVPQIQPQWEDFTRTKEESSFTTS